MNTDQNVNLKGLLNGLYSLFERDRQCTVPLGAEADAAAGFLDPVSESESKMDLSAFFALGAGAFFGLGVESDGFLAAAAAHQR